MRGSRGGGLLPAPPSAVQAGPGSVAAGCRVSGTARLWFGAGNLELAAGCCRGFRCRPCSSRAPAWRLLVRGAGVPWGMWPGLQRSCCGQCGPWRSPPQRTGLAVCLLEAGGEKPQRGQTPPRALRGFRPRLPGPPKLVGDGVQPEHLGSLGGGGGRAGGAGVPPLQRAAAVSLPGRSTGGLCVQDGPCPRWEVCSCRGDAPDLPPADVLAAQ